MYNFWTIWHRNKIIFLHQPFVYDWPHDIIFWHIGFSSILIFFFPFHSPRLCSISTKFGSDDQTNLNSYQKVFVILKSIYIISYNIVAIRRKTFLPHYFWSTYLVFTSWFLFSLASIVRWCKKKKKNHGHLCILWIWNFLETI